MKPTIQNLRRLAAKYNATIEVNSCEGETIIYVDAESGKKWNSSDAYYICANYFHGVKSWKEDIIAEMMDDIRMGYSSEPHIEGVHY
jgi:hypothetical protein